MSDCAQIAQVPHDKRATLSELLRLLMIKEQMSELLVFFSELFCRSQNWTKIIFFGTFFVSLRKPSNLLIPSF